MLRGLTAMNLPNLLTLLRILLVPGFLVTVIYGWLTPALLLFILAGLTDVIDGMLARRLGQQTMLGSYLDPVADKLLMAVSFISLAIVGLVPPWLAVVTVSKDLFVAIGVAILYISGQRPSAAVPTLWGKQTTFLQIVTIALVLFFHIADLAISPLLPLFVLTGIITIFSGMHYILGGIRSMPGGS
jgi:cardiolipin synthase (CMP-forming)